MNTTRQVLSSVRSYWCYLTGDKRDSVKLVASRYGHVWAGKGRNSGRLPGTGAGPCLPTDSGFVTQDWGTRQPLAESTSSRGLLYMGGCLAVGTALALGRGNVSFSPLLIKTASSAQRLKAGSCNDRHSVLYQLGRLLPICSALHPGRGNHQPYSLPRWSPP